MNRKEVEKAREEMRKAREVMKAEADVTEEPAAVVEEETLEESVEVEEKTETEPEPVEPLIGVVAGCTRLNIREKANTDATVVIVAEADTVLMIEPAESTEDWYKVYTESGIEGFCMKKFVELRG